MSVKKHIICKIFIYISCVFDLRVHYAGIAQDKSVKDLYMILEFSKPYLHKQSLLQSALKSWLIRKHFPLDDQNNFNYLAE